MLIREVILSEVRVDIDETALKRVLKDRSLNGDGQYQSENAQDVNLAIADCMVIAARNPDFSEGDLSVKVPRAHLKAEARRLYFENGEPAKAEALRLKIKGINLSNKW